MWFITAFKNWKVWVAIGLLTLLSLGVYLFGESKYKEGFTASELASEKLYNEALMLALVEAKSEWEAIQRRSEEDKEASEEFTKVIVKIQKEIQYVEIPSECSDLGDDYHRVFTLPIETLNNHLQLREDTASEGSANP